MAAYGLYTPISSNKFGSMLLLAGLFLLIYVLVYAGALLAEVFLNSDRSVDFYLRAATGDLLAAFPWATAAAAAWIVIAYFFHQNMIDAVTGSEAVTRQEQPRLYNLLENLCISRGIPMPKLKIMDSPALNAFASGLNRRQYSVTVTTGLLNALNDQEMEAVLGRGDEKSRRHDLGAAQDRGPRRAARRDLGGDGALRRQSARGFCRPVRHPPLGAVADRQAGAVRRRPRPRTAGICRGNRRATGAAGGHFRRPAAAVAAQGSVGRRR